MVANKQDLSALAFVDTLPNASQLKQTILDLNKRSGQSYSSVALQRSGR
jgi:hypothetical protein